MGRIGKASALLLTLIITISCLALLITKPADAQTFSSITIKEDGSIDPPTAPVTQSGNVYQLTQDIFGCITVERFNIIIDGAGHSLQGNGSWRGIQIFNPYNASTINRYDVTVKNFIIECFDEAIDVFGYWGNKISGVVLTNNIISGNNIGIRLSSYERYTNNRITENKIYQNSIGISMEMGHTGENGTNLVMHNDIAENDVGIKFLWMGDYYGPKPNPFQMNNTIYENNFRDNSQQVLNAHVIYDPDCANIWDNNALGNYWSDYEGEDSDGDGIGDKPYVIEANNVDHYTLTHPFSYYMNRPTATPTPASSPTSTLTPASTPHSTINTGAQPPQAEPFPISVLVVALILLAVIIVSALLFRKHRKTAEFSHFYGEKAHAVTFFRTCPKFNLMSKSLALILIAFLCASPLPLGICSSFGNEAENSWRELAPLHQARQGLGVIAVDGSIYALGGSLSDYPFRSIVGTNEQYDTSTNSWVYRASMPTPRVYFAVAEYHSKIYCIGGVTGDKLVDERSGYYTPTESNVVEVYDTLTDTWATKSPIPKGGGAYVSAQEVNGQIYVFDSPNVYAYNPVNDSWTEKDSRQIPRYTTLVKDKIIATGTKDIGFPQDSPYYGGVNPVQQVVTYDPISRNLTQGADATIGIEAGSVGATSGTYAPPMVYVMGVKASKSPAEGVNQAYDPAANSWVLAQPMPMLRTDFGIAVVNDTLFAVGGLRLTYSYDSTGNVQSADASVTGSNEQYTPIGYGTVIVTPTPTTILSPSDRNPPHLDTLYYLIPVGVIVAVFVVLSVLLNKKTPKNPFSAMTVLRMDALPAILND